ncbi:unnamed protein product [Cuscuta epithymum]|uniref:Uncharacterized protein n=1 Tax=Cuscuta epithymum TaxID=186058 RepID=A0AAV0DB36_9ASTE|nr:unnamed protein product [Cuscuta epithymum]
MDPSGETEKCSSSESGWTMYIGSPNHAYDDDDDDQEDYYDNHQNKVRVRSKNFDSDDSMASDASSGPVYHEICQSFERVQGKGKLKSGGEKDKSRKSTVKQHQEEEEIVLSKKKTKLEREDAYRGKSSYGKNRSVLRKKSSSEYVLSEPRIKMRN